MSTPFVIESTLRYPPEDGEPVVPRPVSLSSSYTSKAEFDFTFSGSGSKVVDLGTIATGVRALHIEVDAESTPSIAVNITINGGTDVLQLKPGGFISYGNPDPSAGGITAFTITRTQACRVLVRALG